MCNATYVRINALYAHSKRRRMEPQTLINQRESLSPPHAVHVTTFNHADGIGVGVLLLLLAEAGKEEEEEAISGREGSPQ